MTPHWFKRTLLLLVLLAFGTTSGIGAQQLTEITLAWDPNPEPNIQGYRLHVGTESGGYTEVIPVGVTTNYTFDVPEGSTYYFALTAVNTSGVESDYSEEVVFSMNHRVSGQQLENGFRLTITGAPLTAYRMEASHDLRSWNVITTKTTDSAGRIIMTESRRVQGSARFFRAVKLFQ